MKFIMFQTWMINISEKRYLKKRFSLFLNLFELISGIKKSIFIEDGGASINTNL